MLTKKGLAGHGAYTRHPPAISISSDATSEGARYISSPSATHSVGSLGSKPAAASRRVHPAAHKSQGTPSQLAALRGKVMRGEGLPTPVQLLPPPSSPFLLPLLAPRLVLLLLAPTAGDACCPAAWPAMEEGVSEAGDAAGTSAPQLASICCFAWSTSWRSTSNQRTSAGTDEHLCQHSRRGEGTMSKHGEYGVCTPVHTCKEAYRTEGGSALASEKKCM